MQRRAGFGLWTLDFGLWTLDAGLWTLQLDSHFPGWGVGRMANCMHGAGTAVQDGADHTRCTEQVGSTFDGIPFSNGAEIQHHSLAPKPDGAPAGIEFDQ